MKVLGVNRCCSTWSGCRLVVRIGFGDVLGPVITISVGRKMRESDV